MGENYVITIDGPAGSGKSTAARGLARRLGIRYFNSGALYRAITWLGLSAGIDLDDADALLARLGRTVISTREKDAQERVLVAGRDVTDELFQNRITREVWHVADAAPIRREIGRLAHRLNAGRSFVAEGRDQGTEVFPEADVKIYLDARPEVRSERRRAELELRGEHIAPEEMLRQVIERDTRDKSRPAGRLRMAPDAIRVDNSDFTPEQTLERLLDLVRGRLAAKLNDPADDRDTR